ncbi:YfbM family protein [Thermosynechococcus sp. HN-54]|uniref:DUF1877 family protein n=1 Tax=Thermosynechococcus sp. HN-54 TaxID=2933959 RepID=UPI00202CFB61|nr:DUF1877 family protein [Thermosynechococcus sp. HN-54]URR35842.1 YfbM family protein [Thermosynechococcus sp. HN-54]
MSLAAILIPVAENEPPEDLEALIAAAEEGELPSCILEVEWHGLHWLLTGTVDGGDEPWCYLLKGGIEMTSGEMVNGTPRFLSHQQVDAWHQALQSVTETALAQRFDPEAMAAAHVYPSSIWMSSDQEPWGMLWQAYCDVRDFLANVQQQGAGVLIYFG